MDIFATAALGLTGTLLAVTLKKIRPEIAMLISLATGIVIIIDLCTGIADIFLNLKKIASSNGIDGAYLSIALKACITAYITQFCAQLCADAGEGAVGVKVELAGKIAIVAMSMPIISGFLDAISKLLEGI